MNPIIKRLGGVLVALLVLQTLLGAGSASAAISASQGRKVIGVANNYTSSPYRWGGTTPKGFDCSGYTQYVYNKATGKHLPRTAGGQLKYKKVAKGNARKGDLIIFMRGNTAYHVGLFAGNGSIWHASRPGTTVKKEHIWTSGYVVRRP